MSTDISFHRQRSNTAYNLEKLKKARARASKIQSVKVDEKAIPPMNATDKEEFLTRRTVQPFREAASSSRSKLSAALLLSPKQSQNKFIEYARFDGTAQTMGVPTRTMQIFLTMLPESQRNYPMAVCVSMNAKVQDFIGLICYKCSLANPDVPLKGVRHYGLYITEEDGEVEPDFPPLDVREPCFKFRFSHLALVERKLPAINPAAPSVAAPSNPLSLNQLPNNFEYPRTLSMTSEMESVRHQALLSDEKTRRLNLQQQQTRDLATMHSHTAVIEAPLYQTFRVHMLVMSSFYKVEIQLGVSGEKIEIDPVQQNQKFWTSKQKAVTHKITSIASADLVDVKSSRAVFRIVYMSDKASSSGGLSSSYENHRVGRDFGGASSISGGMAAIDLEYRYATGAASLGSKQQQQQPPSFKHYSFETDLKTAQEIVEKVKNILEVRSSAIRKEFLSYQEKKSRRKNRPKTNIN